MSWLERPACSSVTSLPPASISSGSKVITLLGRRAPSLFPSAMTLAMAAAIPGVSCLSSSPSSVLMTAVALLISPSQKNSSRSAADAPAGHSDAAAKT